MKAEVAVGDAVAVGAAVAVGVGVGGSITLGPNAMVKFTLALLPPGAELLHERPPALSS